MNDLTDDDASITSTLLAELGSEIQEQKKEIDALNELITHQMEVLTEVSLQVFELRQQRDQSNALLVEAIETINQLAEQQAMEDLFYEDVLERLSCFVNSQEGDTADASPAHP